MSSDSYAGIELTPTQQRVLRELVARYRESETPVKGETVAAGVNRNAGTIRNQMQSLKTLQLVEGIPGPQGGYKPKAGAYDALSLQEVSEPAPVPLYYEGDRIEGAIVGEIALPSVLHPEDCRVEVEQQGVATETFEEGGAVVVGPTPCNDLRIDGVVEGVDDVNSALVVGVESMHAPADLPAR
ncbi:TrmB family transcriptional regulator [Haloarcula sediminis]|uniref:TrmB family transcriptional regulator n=1 Tax=Haloarcula sediminis TaxID=3111777 RepID=UPI002D79F727|nr:TrmB family transcriptional regulator [Haloarcula sp. CK38]